MRKLYTPVLFARIVLGMVIRDDIKLIAHESVIFSSDSLLPNSTSKEMFSPVIPVN